MNDRSDFADDLDGLLPADPDVSQFMAYLAREVTLVEAAAVEERLTAEPSFRGKVQPIIDVWAAPRFLDDTPRVTADDNPIMSTEPTPTRAEIDAGWARFQAEQRVVAAPRPVNRRRAWLAAAALLLIVGPLIVIGQLVRMRDRAPGTEPRRSGVSPTTGVPAEAAPGVDLHVGAVVGREAPTASAPPAVPIQPGAPRALGPVVARSQQVFEGVAQVRRLSNGRLLVNDTAKNSLVILDSAFRFYTLVVNSRLGPPGQYGARPAVLLPFRGDSSLLADASSEPAVLRVLDSDGHFVRDLSADAHVIAASRWSSLGLVMASVDAASRRLPTRPAAGMPPSTLRRDELGVLRAFRGSGVVAANTPRDTLSRMLTASTTAFVAAGVPEPYVEEAFFATSDYWTVAADGSIAILRARDYRLDFVVAGRGLVSGPPIPHPAFTIDDDARTRAADSINATSRRTYEADLAAWRRDSVNAYARPPVYVGHGFGATTAWSVSVPLGPAGSTPARRQPPSGIDPATWRLIPDVTRVPRADGDTVVTLSVYGPPQFRVRPTLRLVTAADIPPTLPIVPPVSAAPHLATNAQDVFLADTDNRFWIRTQRWTSVTTAPAGPATYDVVDRSGQLVDRVQVPPDRRIVGFGPGGLVYLTNAVGMVGVVEVVRLR